MYVALLKAMRNDCTGILGGNRCKVNAVFYAHLRPRCPPRPPPLPPLLPPPPPPPSMRLISRSLSLSSAPRILPIAGPSTALSRFVLASLVCFLTSFSRMMPFSRASRRRLSSLAPRVAVMRFRMAMGIFCCWNSDCGPLARGVEDAPRDWMRMSVVRWRSLPDAKSFWDAPVEWAVSGVREERQGNEGAYCARLSDLEKALLQ